MSIKEKNAGLTLPMALGELLLAIWLIYNGWKKDSTSKLTLAAILKKQ